MLVRAGLENSELTDQSWGGGPRSASQTNVGKRPPVAGTEPLSAEHRPGPPALSECSSAEGSQLAQECSYADVHVRHCYLSPVLCSFYPKCLPLSDLVLLRC